MKLNIFLPIFSVLSLGSAASYCPSTSVHEPAQKAIFFEFTTNFYLNKDAKGAFIDHHNPYALSGRDIAITFFTALTPSINFTIMHAAFYNSTGWVHFRQDQTGVLPTAGVDILHMNGSCIVEHWDVLQERPANATNPFAIWSP
ncbi:hypothetical protein BDZ45DRAFT_745150 [Acephala macrosclerotiorum]|nr:hypothetical protein BDZ45DRAFT_745150 [Acephala macrosclerotiorum]